MPGHRLSWPCRGLATASLHGTPIPSILALALVLAAAFAVLAPSPVLAQGSEETPDAAFAAAAGDLAERRGAAADAVQLLRAEAVTWNDACLGAADADELCAQVLVDGWALWLGDGALAYRYHTDLSGDSLRLAEGELSPDAVPEAPLPPGATLRGPRAEPVIETEPVAGPTTLAELYTALEAAGLPTSIQEIAIQRDGIPVSSAGRILVGTAAIEPYQLESAAAVEATLDRFRADGGVPPPANATIWGSGSLIVILINAPENPALEATLNEILGFPAIATIAGLPPPPPTGGPGEGPPLIATSVEAIVEALRSTGLDVFVTDSVVAQPWLPEGGVQLDVGGAAVDLFLLSSSDAVSEATASRKNGPASVQPPPNVAVWLNGTAFIILREAPNHPEISDAISSLFGPPQFTTIAGLQPPVPPEALPTTGSGGENEDDNPPAWVWGVIGTVAGLAVLVGAAYSHWRRRPHGHEDRQGA